MFYIGIDLGGTNTAVGIVDDHGRILAQTTGKTPVGQPVNAYLACMSECIRCVLKTAGLQITEIRSIGIGIPGIVDTARGTVTQCTNLDWYDVPFQRFMEQVFPLPILMDNDANLAALAESCAGASIGCSSSVLITLGTGVGSGIILGGRPWSGAFGQAGELGHSTLVADGIPCRCGRNGCMEQYCSATALVRNARQICGAFPQTIMCQMAGGDLQNLTAKMVIDAAKEGDPYACRVFDRYTHYLALAIDSIINTLDPEIVLIGGGISHAGDFLLNAVRNKIPRHENGSLRPIARIELAKLRNGAGLIGAAMLGRQL